MILKMMTNYAGDYGKNLRQRRWAFLAILAIGLVGLGCYVWLVPDSGLGDYAQGFYLGGACGITGAGLGLLMRNEWMLRHPEKWKRARIQETDERSQRIVAQAYDSKLLFAQFDERRVPEAEVLACCPAAPVHLFRVVLHLLGDVQNMGKDHLGNGVGAVGGNIGDNDAAFFGSGGVYDVVSGSQHTDVFQFGQCRHVLGGEHGFVGQQDFCTSGAFQYFRRGGAVVDGALAQGLQFVPAKVTGVGGIAV